MEFRLCGYKARLEDMRNILRRQQLHRRITIPTATTETITTTSDHHRQLAP